MSPRSARLIGGLEMLPPLDLETERGLYPVIKEGRRADDELRRRPTMAPVERRRLRRIRHAGQEAESLLLRATFGLVRARVNERGYRFDDEDLEAAGVEGLVNALRRFDPEHGARFATYANYWITKMVSQAIGQRAGLTDTEMRLVTKFQRLERADPKKRWSPREVANELGVSSARAAEVMQVSRDLAARRFSSEEIDDLADPREDESDGDAPAWVIEELKRLTGKDFDAFWQYTFHTMTMEELASAAGISRQGMAKRIEKCRRAVRESPDAARLLRWLGRK